MNYLCGLSTDEKPIKISEPCLFLELDTGNIYYLFRGVWVKYKSVPLNRPGLVVMTYNVQRCRGINSQTAMQTAILNKYDADIIGFQELGTASSLPSELNAVSGYAVKQFSNHNNKLLSMKKTGVLSNVVIADFDHQDPQDMSMWGETRAYMKAEFEWNGKNVAWINTHLCYMTQSVKWEQMAEIFAIAQSFDRCIITGDFNAYGDGIESDDYIHMFKQYVDAGYNLANCSPNAYVMTYTKETTASSLADLTSPVDNIIVTGNIAMKHVVFDTTKFSYLNGSQIDHIPVIATLTIN